MTLDYNDVFKFMKDFGIDYINKYNELIIDEKTNTYVGIENCKNIDDVRVYVVFALCRPIGKGLEKYDSSRLLNRLNNYFNTNLTKENMLLMYQELCYTSKIEEFRNFIHRKFPMDELVN
jgi:hypothetical protein